MIITKEQAEIAKKRAELNRDFVLNNKPMRAKYNPTRTEPWLLTQLHDELIQDLLKFPQERGEIIKEYKKDLEELAMKINNEGRPFSPMEMIILIGAINL